ncbi:hypothetical protein AAG906_024584 [Vitis piasezkii]
MDWVEKIIEAIATFVEFPYNLEDHASSTWFAVVSLAVDVQSIMKCIRFIDDVMTMVGLMSAQFSKPLVASKATHLVCHKFKRYLYARSWLNTLLAVRGTWSAEVRKSGLSYRALRMFWIMQSPSDGCNPNETLNLSGSIWMDVQASKFKDKSTAAMSTFGDILCVKLHWWGWNKITPSHFKPKPSWEEEIHWLTAYKSLAVQVNQSLYAAINPGNSRDPLLDSKGRMSGIDTAIFTQTGRSRRPGHGCLVKIRTSSLFNWDKSMDIKMFDGDSFHSEKNKKSILVDDSFMIQPQSIVDDQSNSHFGTDISMVADIAGVTQPQTAEHVMTSWTLEMDYANNISSTEADRGPSDMETTGCINDELASNGKSIGSTNTRPKALGEPLVQSRSEIIMASTKEIDS